MGFTDSINKYVTSSTDYVTGALKNEYVSTILIILAILYGGLAAPKLPEQATKIIKHPVFLLLAITAIAYLASKNVSVALIAGLAVCISLISVNNYKNLSKLVKREYLEGEIVSNNVVDSASIPPVSTDVIQPAQTEQPITEAKVVELPEVKVESGAPKMVVVDEKGEPVKDDNGVQVVAPPTVVTDEQGVILVDEKKEPVVVPPQAAVDETGNIAKDMEGKVIVAPPVVVKNEKGEIKKDENGKIMVNSCMVSVDGGNSVQILYGNRRRGAMGGKGIFDDYNMMFDVSEQPTDNLLSKVCVGDQCMNGYEPACLAPIN